MELDVIKEYYRNYYSEELGLGNIEKRVRGRITRERSKRTLAKLRKLLDFKDKSVLDVGCGPGEFVVTLNLHGIKTMGVTPDEDEVEVAKVWQKYYGLKNNVVKGYGEKLPFEDNTFDIVLSHHVLEHVDDVKKTVDEMLRVLMTGGSLYISTPNYWKPKEGHYGIFWPPFLPKSLSSLYLKLRRRPTDFIDHINYTTPSMIKNIFKQHNVNVQNLNKAGFFSPVEVLVKKLD